MLTRDKAFIEQNLIVKDNKVFTKEKLIIEFPKWYENKEFLDRQSVTYLYGVFAMIIGNKYSVSVIPTLITTQPIMVNEVEKEDGEYIQFIYGKGDCIIENINVVKKELLAYNLFENFFIYSRVPWFIEYEDLIRITDNLSNYAKSNLGNNQIAMELVISFIARCVEDKRLFFRQKEKDYKSTPEYVDLLNIYWSVRSSAGKLGGNYFSRSLVSAIVQPETEETKLEKLVRQ